MIPSPANNSVPTTKLSNGVTVANFSSPHAFVFTDGSILNPCHADRSKWLMLRADEVESPGIKGTTDIELTFVMSDEVQQAIEGLQKVEEIDIVIVPLPVMKSMVAAGLDIGKCRSIRMADRITKTTHIDRWCKS
jgi:hypothetical protein